MASAPRILMLRPIRTTDARLNSLSVEGQQKKTKKSAKFTDEGSSPPPPPRGPFASTGKLTDHTALLMAAEREAKKPRTQSRPVTPAKKVHRPLRSASTWRRTELEQCGVIVQRDVDPSKMIPQKFFNFSKLKHYPECSHPSYHS